MTVRAGVSRETFYEQFASKDDCFLETFDAVGEIVLGRIAATGLDESASRAQRFERILTTYLDTLASEPALARLYLVEAHAAGTEALHRRAALQQRFTAALAELLGAHEEHERFACELLVAGVGAMVTTRLALGEHDSLRDLHAPVADLVRRALG